MQNRRVAIVHDWLTGMRGGEKALEVLCELFPQADLYTLLHHPGTVSPTIEKHRIHTSFIQHLPYHRTAYRYYLPLFPIAIASFDLAGYNLILSSSHCVAKGVRVPDGVCHITYLHTPMRYIWDQYDAYFNNQSSSFLVRTGMKIVRPMLRRWDIHSNDGVYAFMANSACVAARIEYAYHRKADVMYGPLDLDRFSVSLRDNGFYLMVTALVPYKRVDLAILTFNQLKWPLKIIGTGPEERALKNLAGPTVEFLGWQSDEAVSQAYATCRVLLFPGEEDFGLVPLEAMASGKPVIAYAKGGALETVIPHNRFESDVESDQKAPTGVFFFEQTQKAMMDAVLYFEKHKDQFDPDKIRDHVAPFDRERFKERIRRYIEEKYQTFKEEVSHAKTSY